MSRFGACAAAIAALLLSSACGGDDAPAAIAPAPANQEPRPGEGDYVAYRQSIPGTDVGFDMVPVPGGTFAMGSPAGEPGRADDEGPQVEVALEPFWIGRCEVTWAEYEAWAANAALPQNKVPDGLSRPTPAYTDMAFGMGRDGSPAIGMTHVAARQYCKWLSEKTGRFHRLPTEAEWEYACRAGSTAAFGFGDDPAQLGEHAWYADNSARELERGAPPVRTYHPVGQKRPNAWGLCDMHGNVAEWVADGYFADAYAAAHGASPRRAPFLEPLRDAQGRTLRYPHVVRGGSYGDEPAALRCAARRASHPDWNQRDPQIPKSWWYLTEGRHVGFRVVRPWREPTSEERARFETP